MNFFEVEIAKYRRRLERIGSDPSSVRAASNTLLYEAWLKRREGELAGWREQRPFVYCTIFHDLLEAMNVLTVPCSIFADLAADLAPECLAEYIRRGYPEAVCDKLQLWLGMTLGGKVPPPVACIGGSPACDAEQQMVIAPAHHYGVPYFNVDRCIEPGYEPVEYVYRQLRELVAFVEAVVPGARWDEARLGEILDKRRVAQGYVREALYDSARNVPCPLRSQDVMRIPFLGLAYRPGGLAYFEAFRDEMVHKVRSGSAAHERLRFMWALEVPHRTQAFALLEQRGVAVPIYLFDALDQFCGVGDHITWGEGERWRGLSPLEEYARLQVGWTWGGPVDRWIASLVAHCRDFKIDGVIYCMRSGCAQSLGVSKVVQERLEAELGTPMCLVEGYLSDPERWDDRMFLQRLDAFIDFCLDARRTTG